ncbi:hypothetical protein [Bordetella sp. N]|uniref:hypothetical protein n=1 Tax=Bordetella sp. N TaxID=1746199 RepID=UPI00070BB283|nr:hypothetical protein [Bordetella sp. N]ALM84590.1 hypothetical protein ASB57_17830 [Bordetella sp. N]
MKASKLLQMLAQIDVRIRDAERRVQTQYRVIGRRTTAGEVLKTALRVLSNLEETLDALRGARSHLLVALKREARATLPRGRCDRTMPTSYRKKAPHRASPIQHFGRWRPRLKHVFLNAGERPSCLICVFAPCCSRSGTKLTDNIKRDKK